jgi:hypothetical protein
MKAINFTDKEIEFLQYMYQEELVDAEKYTEQIKDVLKKLGAPIRETTEEPVEKEPKKKGKKKGKKGKKRGRKAKIKENEKAEPKKRGRKPKVNLVKANPVSTIELNPAPSKVVKAAVKNAPKRRPRIKGMVTLTRLSKPLPKKEPVVEPAKEN